eukprot:g593.t1
MPKTLEPLHKKKSAKAPVYHRGKKVQSLEGYALSWEVLKTAKKVVEKQQARRARLAKQERRHHLEKLDHQFHQRLRRKQQRGNKENNDFVDSKREFAKLDEETRNALEELREIRKAENAEKESGKSSEMLSEMGFGGFGFLLPKSDEEKYQDRVDLGLKRTGIWRVCGIEDQEAPKQDPGARRRQPHTLMTFEERSAFKDLLFQLSQNKIGQHLVYLTLQRHKIGDDELKLLCRNLTTNHTVKALILNHNNITTKGISFLCNYMKQTSQLQTLNLGSNLIDDRAVERLAKTMRRNVGLTELNLTGRKNVVNDFTEHFGRSDKWPRITADGAVMLAVSCTRHMTIKILCLSMQKLGDEGARAMATMLTTQESLEQLDLDNNGITAEGCRELGNGLRLNKALTALNISSNDIKDEGFQSMGDSLAHNKHLRVLDVADNKMKGRGANSMAKGILRRGLVPLKLIFHGNPVFELEDGQKLQKASNRSEGAARTTFRKTAMSTMQSLLEAEEHHMSTVVSKAVDQRREDSRRAKALLDQQLNDAKGVVRRRSRRSSNLLALDPADRDKEVQRRDVWKSGDVEGVGDVLVNDEETAALFATIRHNVLSSTRLDPTKIKALATPENKTRGLGMQRALAKR